ncbi:hypothetical protein JDN40_12465 [Rhodomicrobium vannielii ATCC 17100]|uniref:Uncharacterized protein n=1 Tax=Rhodomicrobium udaipurense TaxID=1202716 RepID=A0A8I1GG50_9HYPH|nr:MULTISPECIES: hypothetical protein [Rhodomicrobium]MBJ7534920.1 hypothetical protein [Rhodomicrobium vannielii ATCC 17100]MBJ7544214.1 hypothetical protein [Rhodomicrobium udaipurense]
MSEAQIGLLVVTLIISGFAMALFHMGVLQSGGARLAICASVAIAAALFLTQ